MRKRQQAAQQQHRAQEHSALLACLERLDEAAWAEVLLKKLVAAGAAANLAATCTRLRQLVHGSCKGSLDFSDLRTHSNLRQIEEWTAALPEHFPSCEGAWLFNSCENSYLVAQALVPALSRLPKLHSISLLTSTPPSNIGLTMQLGIIREQLPRLQSYFVLSWYPWMPVGTAWQQLGSMSQLTHLELNFTGDRPAMSIHDLAKLGGLQNLQELAIHATAVDQHPAGGPGLQFLGQLTALTSLCVRLPTIQGLASVSSCCRLAALTVAAVDDDVDSVQVQLTAAECAAVSRLTCLTQLSLTWPLQADAVPVFHSALQQLARLQHVGAASWPHQVLPVFAKLKHLQRVAGAWETGQQGSAGGKDSSSCPQVQALEVASGSVPFKAFPNLQSCSHANSFTPSALMELHRHCPNLQDLLADGVVMPSKRYRLMHTASHWVSMSGAAQLERVAALHSLAQLKGLSRLELQVQDDAELAALASGLCAVREARLLVPIGCGEVTPNGLMQLGRLPELNRLQLQLCERFAHACAQSIRMMWCSLSSISHVEVTALPELASFLKSAYDWALTTGLRVPRVAFDTIGLELQELHISSDDGSSEEEASEEEEEEEGAEDVPALVPIEDAIFVGFEDNDEESGSESD